MDEEEEDKRGELGMILSLPKARLAKYIQGQLNSLFPDGSKADSLGIYLDDTLDRLETSFNAISDAHFWQGGETFFNHLHSDQYAMFLYLLSNTIQRRTDRRSLCDKIFFLNKALYGIDAFYEVELPGIFLFSHAGGTVLGRARYSDYFLVYQQCTVGSARAAEKAGRGVFPVLGRHVSLYAGAAVLGACHIGDNCKISAHSVIINKRLKPNTIYRGRPQSFETVIFPFPDNIWK
jgi:serine O-acetyltransferase